MRDGSRKRRRIVPGFRSIGGKIFLYMLIFSLLLIAIIGIGTRFVLPGYYMSQQLAFIDEAETDIRKAYDDQEIELVIDTMEFMEAELGGELYYFDEVTGQQGYGMGRGKNRLENANSEKFIPQDEVTVYNYINKIGLDIYVIGIALEDNYLVYEVGIQSLNKATETMMDFIVILLGIVLIMSILISFILSRTISRPIRSLNELAESMKSKTVDPLMVTKEDDEIGQLNQTLNELYEELRGSIYQLNAELHKERNAEKLKKRFLAQATHELKTPIAVIRGYAEILYDGMYKDEEERDRYLQNIYEESESVSHLILDVLDYTKMETGNYKLTTKSVEIKGYFDKLFSRYGEFISSEGLSFYGEVNVPIGYELAIDPDRIEQVFKNLISNGVEHARSQISVTVSKVGERIRLSVENDGGFISDEDMPNLFESFYKKMGKKKGSGLGLAIVKEIVLLHHGEYMAMNKEDSVEFVIIL